MRRTSPIDPRPTLFRFTPGGTLTTLAQGNFGFDGLGRPLIAGSDGHVYGFINNGEDATFFRLESNNNLTPLATIDLVFAGKGFGGSLSGAQGADGAFYITRNTNNANNGGAIFRFGEGATPTPTPTATATPTPSPTPSPSATPTPTATVSPTPTITPSPSPTPNPTPSLLLFGISSQRGGDQGFFPLSVAGSLASSPAPP